jgi:ribosomal protein L22
MLRTGCDPRQGCRDSTWYSDIQSEICFIVSRKLLESAVANAENNNGISRINLYVAECYANKAPTMKRIHPRAQGRAYRIEKRTSHITVVLDER